MVGIARGIYSKMAAHRKMWFQYLKYSEVFEHTVHHVALW